MLFKDLERHGSTSTQHHLDLALKKLNNQDQLLINQNHLISELQTTMASQREHFLTTQNNLLRTQNQLLERLSRVENQSDLLFLKGEHIWKIPRFSVEVERAKQSTSPYTLSKEIYTPKGYKLNCLLYPCHPNHKSVSLYFCSVQGNFDGSLIWPMETVEIKSCVIDMDGKKKKNRLLRTTGLKMFVKPPHSNGQYGFRDFVHDNQVAKYTRDDVLTIEINTVHL